MPRIPLNIKGTKYHFARCKTEEAATELYEHTLETIGEHFTEPELGMLRAIYEHRIYDIKNPTLALTGRSKSKKDGRFISSGEDER